MLTGWYKLLSKWVAYRMDCYTQNQDLLLIKLSASSFPYGVIEFIQSYLNYYPQRVNMNDR